MKGHLPILDPEVNRLLGLALDNQRIIACEFYLRRK